MKPADLDFVKRLAATKGVSLTDAGVRRGQTLGYAIDSVLAAADKLSPASVTQSRWTAPSGTAPDAGDAGQEREVAE